MKLLCISCSNVLHKGPDSASTRVCHLVEQLARQSQPELVTTTLSLVDFKLKNCLFCGQCRDAGRCTSDEQFNALYAQLCASDRIVLVVPFYAIVPAKLTMLLEKLNQIFYTAWLRNPDEPSALRGKKVVLVAHGGSNLTDNPEAAQNYRALLLKPLNYCWNSLGTELIGPEVDAVKGIVFGVTGYETVDGAVFPEMVHDWQGIEELLTPLAAELVS